MSDPLTIVIPTAGWATRMRPQTWSKPKPLVSVAGRTVIDTLLESFRSLPGAGSAHYVIIYSPGLGETQIPPYLQEHHPHLKVSYALQAEMKGQSHAISLARRHLSGRLLVCFSDTLIATDFSFLGQEDPQAVAWVKQVPDPRRFGVAEVDGQGWVTRLVEKPESLHNNRVVVGCYYFRQGADLVSAIDQQVQSGVSRKGEFFLTDTINIMIEHGLQMRTETVDVWLDTGTIPATLETNRYLLEHGHASQSSGLPEGVRVIPPVFLHPTAEVRHSVIGPHAAIGAGCRLHHARVEDSILEDEVVVENIALKGCFVGRRAHISGRSDQEPPLELNIGDDSKVILK